MLKYAPRAGERAQAMYAPQAAVEQFTHTLEAAGHLSLTPTAHLYRARGRAYETLGDFERAHADLQAALEAARAADDRQAEWQVLLDLGYLWASRDYTRAGACFRQALDLAEAIGESALRAHSLNRLGNWHLNIEEPDAARQHHQEALAIFQELGDERGLAQTLDLLGMTHFMGSDLIQGAAYWQQAIAHFQQLNDRQGLVGSLISLPLSAGTYQTSAAIAAPMTRDEVMRTGELALGMAREIGWRAAEAFGLFVLAFVLGPCGEYARALNLAQSSLGVAEEIRHRQWMTAAHCILGALYVDLLAPAPAQHHLEAGLALAQEIGSQYWLRNVSAFLAWLYLLQNSPDRAEAALDAALPQDVPMHMLGQRLCWSARTELALARHQPERALDIAERLIATATNLNGERVIPYLWQLRGEALAALHRPAEAEAALRAAAQAAHDQDLRPRLWRIQAALGRLLHAQRGHDEAEAAFALARAVVAELAANIPDEALRAAFLQASATQIPPAAPLSPRRAAKQEWGGLTERERAVATLIAQGKSNREIARALVVSERTVETHVGNILNKLGFTSRAQIAAWAVEKGLAQSAAP